MTRAIQKRQNVWAGIENRPVLVAGWLPPWPHPQVARKNAQKACPPWHLGDGPGHANSRAPSSIVRRRSPLRKSRGRFERGVSPAPVALRSARTPICSQVLVLLFPEPSTQICSMIQRKHTSEGKNHDDKCPESGLDRPDHRLRNIHTYTFARILQRSYPKTS